jgi:hypothetical protein
MRAPSTTGPTGQRMTKVSYESLVVDFGDDEG